VEDSCGRKDRLPVLFSADSADSNTPQSIEIVAARAIENKRKLIDLCDRWIAPLAKPLAYEQAPLWAQILIRSRSGGDLGLTSRRGGALAGMMAAGGVAIADLAVARIDRLASGNAGDIAPVGEVTTDLGLGSIRCSAARPVRGAVRWRRLHATDRHRASETARSEGLMIVKTRSFDAAEFLE
jgi:hypothetical protein